MLTLRVEDQRTFLHGSFPFEAVDTATSYLIDGRWFSPKYKQGLWDGRKRLLRKGRGSTPPNFPTGLLSRVIAAMHGTPYTIDERRTIAVFDPCETLGDAERGEISLYDHQQRAVDEMAIHGRGIVQVATGGGKTEIGAAAIKSIGQPALWLTHRVLLARQTQARLAQRLGTPVGLLGDGVWDARDINVGMVQTLTQTMKTCNERSEFLKKIPVLIGDEIHHLQSDQWYDLFDKVKAAYRYGLTATLPQGNEALLLEAQTGPLLYEVRASSLIEAGILVPPRIWFAEVTGPKNSSCEDWRALYNLAVVNNSERNELIKSIVHQLVRDRKPTLCLVIRVSHCKALAKELKESGLNAVWITSQITQAVRQQYLRGLADGTIDCVVAMASILGEGIDSGDIRAIVNASGTNCGASKNDMDGNALIQFIGRGMRHGRATDYLPEKRFFDYVDFLDLMHKDMRRASRRRLDTLIGQGYGERVGRWQDYASAVSAA